MNTAHAPEYKNGKRKKNFNGYFHGKDHLSQSVSLKSSLREFQLGLKKLKFFA
ncbi:hypothetical protein LBBP_02723 [Leptospira borgpetersenii serovar Ballum]|uniref:Uncharacterized protein n=1 Tax=Leptospira borgpetersenii serovar Ballum TaxID=280505 RepID=A0A0S2ITG3_LEPBO|nr:hypothetical protein LBBP_02723 [Leptospira borgpetersenii serovar Ballum]